MIKNDRSPYVEGDGKHPKGKKEFRKYSPTPKESWLTVMARYDLPYIKVDIDDFNRSTGELVDAIHDRPRSEYVLSKLDAYGLKYNAMKTTNGVHIFMKLPEGLFNSNRINWVTPIDVKMEWKLPTSDDHITLKRNGTTFNWIKGCVENHDVDELPYWLYPMQKSKLDLVEEGNRVQGLSAYLFHLVKFNFSPEQIFTIVELRNESLKTPLSKKELFDSVLNASTMERLREVVGSHNTKRGVSLDNFRKFLETNRLVLKYNLLTKQTEYENVPDQYKTVNDRLNGMPIVLHDDFQKFTGTRMNKSTVTDYIFAVSDENAYNPVHEYLRSESWDEVDRFGTIYQILNLTNDIEKILVKKWFIQCVALSFNTLENPIGAEGVLILSGKEAIGKSRFFRLVCPYPDWFRSKSNAFRLDNKDNIISVLSGFITEIGEIDATLKMKRSDLKSFITESVDSLRRPYAREECSTPRTTSFCGTTNETEFLDEHSGYRRWWNISVSYIDNERLLKFVSSNELKQFWSQCYSMYKKDPNYFRLTKEELSILEKSNEEVTLVAPSEQELRDLLDFEMPIEYWGWYTLSALKASPRAFELSRYSPKEIGVALTRIKKEIPKIEKRRTSKGVEYLLPFKDIKSR